MGAVDPSGFIGGDNAPGGPSSMIGTRTAYLRRWSALKRDRASWIDHWRDLSAFIRPRNSRFTLSETNRGTKRNDSIINSAASVAARTLASGMMAGITSPARPWFRLTTGDPDLRDVGSVRSWLHVVEERMRTQIARSNIYTCLPVVYDEIGIYGTSVFWVDEDVKDVIRGYVLPVGTYALQNDSRQQVDTIYRDVQFSVGQVVQRFGLDVCSTRVKAAHKNRQLEDPVKVIQVIEPNLDMVMSRCDCKGMKWASTWFELEASEGETNFLGRRGYNEFPAMCPRWFQMGNDVYGSNSPGMEALGDSKQVQFLERRKAQIVDYMIKPPLQSPAALRATRALTMPGDVNYVDSSSPANSIRPILEIPPASVQVVEASIRETEKRIDEYFYADLFLMLSQSDRREITAREVDERHEEKMLQLGPVLERLHSELLDPLIDRVFYAMLRRGMFPPPPEELASAPLDVEYVSILAQAQKLLATSGIERLASFVGNMANADPGVMQKLDSDKVVEEYAQLLGVKPDLVRGEDEMKQIRAQQAQAQQAQQAVQNGQGMSQAAANLGKADLNGDNALSRLLSSLGPQGSAVAPPGVPPPVGGGA
jgi:Bacteriophage head to tail connecting protein